MPENINIVSKEAGKLNSRNVQATPYEFTIATRAKWEMVIAGEDMTIGAGRFEKIGVKKINIQKDTLAIPCAFNHHALASVLKLGGKGGCSAPVEQDRVIESAYILGVESGDIRRGDLLAVINIFPIMFTRDATTPIELL